MLMRLRPKTDLRTLIALLAITSIVITLANAMYATWRVQRMVLIDSTLEANRAYATKLASTTEIFFQLAQSQLHYSAMQLGKDFDNPQRLQNEVDRLREQTSSFNSVAVVDTTGMVKAISPESLMLQGMHLTSDASRDALSTRQPMVSKPTISAANNLIVFVSWPIWSSDGRYLGYVGGTIYLKKKSILNALLGEQYYRDGTNVYVLDSNNQVLYHQNPLLVGKTLPAILSDRDRQEKTNGTLQVNLPDEKTKLAGYAIVPTTGWLVVALKPMDVTLEPLSGLLFKVLKHSVPLALLTLLVAVILARLIALPLWQLARKASQMDAPGVSNEIGGIRAWYFEAAQVKRALLTGIGLVQDKIGRLSSEVQTDPLTQLLNRRGLHRVLDYFQALRQPFAILALDIDHFKKVNDTWGHDVGDRVIQQVAKTLQASARQTDVVCRNGGEEFLMLLPGSSTQEARVIAERVRTSIAETWIEDVGHITLSVGVAAWAGDDTMLEECLKQADGALYQAKHAGRNCVVLADAMSSAITISHS